MHMSIHTNIHTCAGMSACTHMSVHTVCMSIRIHRYAFVRPHLRMYVPLYESPHTQVCSQSRTCPYIHMSTHVPVNPCLQACMCLFIQMSTPPHVFINMHIHKDTCMSTLTHMSVRMHVHTHVFPHAHKYACPHACTCPFICMSTSHASTFFHTHTCP